PDWEDPLAMADEVDDVAGNVAFGRAGHADRRVQGDVNVLLGRPDLAAGDAHAGAVLHLRAERRDCAVDGDAPGCDPGVGFAARADAGFADVLVQAHEYVATVRPSPGICRAVAKCRASFAAVNLFRRCLRGEVPHGAVDDDRGPQ